MTILTTALLSLTLLLPAPSAPSATPPPVPVAPAGLTAVAAHQRANDDEARTLSVNRPSRGGYSSAVRRAATFPTGMRGCAAAIYARESGATLDRRGSGQAARNPVSSASGRAQFLDTSWRRPLSFHVRDRLIEFGVPRREAKRVRLWLEQHHITEWSGWLQDIAFIETVERGGYGPWGGCPG